MSGHSKWAKIKRSKGIADQKKGQLYTKLGHTITLAAREGGGDPDTNFALRLAVDRAKGENMPKENIERAITRGTGEEKGLDISDVIYEAFGPGGVPVMIECSTDNKNRTTAEVRKIIEASGGRLAETGSVAWQFETKGLIVIECAKMVESEKFGKGPEKKIIPNDEVSLEIMEIDGVEDVQEQVIRDDEDNDVNGVEIFTSRENMAGVLKKIQDLKFRIVSAELIQVPKNKVEVADDIRVKLENFIGNVEEHEDVQGVFSAAT